VLHTRADVNKGTYHTDDDGHDHGHDDEDEDENDG